MKIYNYNPSTFEFLSESDANLDPLEGKPLVPANGTLIKNILATQKNKAIIFNQDLQKWEYIPDFRNKVLANKQNGSLFTIEKLNIDPANLTDYTDILPTEGNQKWDEANQKWFKELPLAMGTDLVRFVNQTTESTLDDFQAFGIVSKLKDFLLYCQQGRCNPFTRSTFNNTLQTLDKAFANGQKELIVGLVNKWAKTVRFEE
jgi:hypothetical protein